MPKTVTVMFVPQTKKGELAKRLQMVEDDIAKVTGSRVRVVERSGVMVRKMLHRSNPWAGGDCGRKKCLPCLSSDGKTNCFTKNVVYSIECISCEEGKKLTTCYIGETSRSLHCRGVEHWEGFMGKKDNNPMFKHSAEAHDGEVNKTMFRMRILKQHFTAMSRQIHEGVAIARRSLSGLNLINSKMEGAYNRCKLPRITVVGSEEERSPIVELKPANELENSEVDRCKAMIEKKRIKHAGSKGVSRQLSSQSSLHKYFHSKPTKFRKN